MGLWVPTVSTITLVLIATPDRPEHRHSHRDFGGAASGVNRVVHAGARRDADHAGLRLPDPGHSLLRSGPVAAIFATVIFSMPPAIRLTCLGIKQVPRELVECGRRLRLHQVAETVQAATAPGHAHHHGRREPDHHAGLSMVVIAAMIGARGLGGEVWRAIQRLQMGQWFRSRPGHRHRGHHPGPI
jgi:glycine betaine/proline transport system permease protein